MVIKSNLHKIIDTFALESTSCNSRHLQKLVIVACLASLVSLCLNCPQYLTWYPFLIYATVIVDIFCFAILSANLISRLRAARLTPSLDGRIFDPMMIFDGILVLMLLASTVLQVFIDIRHMFITSWTNDNQVLNLDNSNLRTTDLAENREDLEISLSYLRYVVL